MEGRVECVPRPFVTTYIGVGYAGTRIYSGNKPSKKDMTMGEGVLRMYHAGTMLWVRIPERGIDPTFLRSIPGTSWDASLKAFAVQDRYLVQLLSNMYEQEELAPHMPPYVHPSEDREDFPGQVTTIIEELARVRAYRTGESTESVPEILRYNDLIPRPYQYQGARFIMEARRVILGLNMGHGKGPQPLSAGVLTPSGWKTMGDMRVGDFVIGADGQATEVVAVHDLGIQQVYTVRFKDGSSTECTEDHEWAVRRPNDWSSPHTPTRDRVRRTGWARVRATKHLVKFTDVNCGVFIPMVKPVNFVEQEQSLLVPPYILGLLLGDGTMHHSYTGYTTADPELLYALEQYADDNGMLVKKPTPGGNKYGYRLAAKIRTKRSGDNHLLNELRKLGLGGGCRSYEKFVPDMYKLATVNDRIALLQGLLDTDGSTSQNQVEFSSVSLRLAKDVRFLVQSLGGTATLTQRQTTYTHNGVKKDGRPSFRVGVSMPPDICPFRLERKRLAYTPRSKYLPNRRITSIEYSRDSKVRCITVAAEDGLYVTDDFIVTHNCTALTAMQLVRKERPKDWKYAVVFCPASTKELVWRREVVKFTDLKPLVVEGDRIDRGFDYRSKADVYILNPELVHRDLPEITELVSKATFLVVDEASCFPPDTMVDTPSGKRTICSFQKGDPVNNVVGTDHVAEVSRRQIVSAVRLWFGGRTLIVSPDHLFFTERGWVSAGHIVEGDNLVRADAAVRMVRDASTTASPQAEILRKILLSEMADVSAGDRSKGTYAGSSREDQHQAEIVAERGFAIGDSRTREDSPAMPDEQPEFQGKGVGYSESNRAQTQGAWGQRHASPAPSMVVGATVSPRLVGNGTGHFPRHQDSRVPHELQSGFRKRGTENCGGIGRWDASRAAGYRPEEGYETCFSRVDRVEILEPGHPDLERYRDAERVVYFYDLTVVRHPSYSVEGIVVHNCLKGASSKISKVIESLSKSVPYFVEMTGTPLENDIMELYRLVTILNPGVFRSEKEFRYQYMPRDDNGKWVTHGVQNLKELRRLTGPVLFQRSKDQLKGQLPLDIPRLEPIRLSDEQREIYEKIRKEEWVKLEQYKAEGDTAKKYLVIKGGLAALTRMLQVCSGLENLGLTGSANPKIARLIEMFDTDLQQDKVLIFTQYKTMTKVIKAALAETGVKSVILSGDESKRARELAVDSFQTNPETRAIIMTTAGGRGLNLTAASAVVLFNLIWNPKMMDQIIGRAIRFGNKAESVTITTFVAEGTAEEKMLAMNAAKSALFDAVLGMAEPSEDLAANVTQHASNMFSQLLEMFE